MEKLRLRGHHHLRYLLLLLLLRPLHGGSHAHQKQHPPIPPRQPGTGIRKGFGVDGGQKTEVGSGEGRDGVYSTPPTFVFGPAAPLPEAAAPAFDAAARIQALRQYMYDGPKARKSVKAPRGGKVATQTKIADVDDLESSTTQLVLGASLRGQGVEDALGKSEESREVAEDEEEEGVVNNYLGRGLKSL